MLTPPKAVTDNSSKTSPLASNQSTATSTTSSSSWNATESQQKPTTIAYIYDIPKDDKYNAVELTKILNDLGYKCHVQVQREGLSKPFLSAIVKFDSVA